MNWRAVSYGIAALLWLASVLAAIVVLWKTVLLSVVEIPLIGSLLGQGPTVDRIAPWLILVIFGYVLIDL
jgi:hypothetical protein